MTTRDKVIGMLLGVGIGDALGRCCEGMDHARVKSTYGKVEKYIIQNAWPEGRKAGVGTDDTQLTLAVAAGLLLSGGKPDMDAQVEAHVKAFRHSTYGWGRTTYEGVRRLSFGVPWQETGLKDGVGNGCPMKIAPTSLLLLRDVPDATGFIADLCSMTHQTSMAVSAGLAQAFGLAYCLRSGPENFDPAAFVRVVVNASQKGKDYFSETLTDDDITDRLGLSPSTPSGPRNGALPRWRMAAATFIAACRSPSCSSCGTPGLSNPSTKSCSAGGDTDTNGSMVGACSVR